MKKQALPFTIFMAIFLCILSNCSTKDEFPFITTEALSQGIKAKTLYIFDNNTPALYKQKHIPTAVFLSTKDPEPQLLPPDKNSNLVFYCKNTRCTASHQGARFAKAQGYANVQVYPLGIDGWEKAGMSLESGEPLLNKIYHFDSGSTVPKTP